MPLGNITYIPSRNRYRFRYGRNKPVSKTFKTKTEALAFQRSFKASQTSIGKRSLEELMKHQEPLLEALRLLQDAHMDARFLPKAVDVYLATVDTDAYHYCIHDALEQVYNTPRFKALAKSTATDYRSRWNRFAEHLGLHRRLDEITPEDVQSWIDKQPTEAATYKTHLCVGVLYRVFFMRTLRLVSKDIMDAVRAPHKPSHETKPIYTLEEVQKLLSSPCSDPKLHFMIWVGFMSGLRSSELSKLTKRMFYMGKSYAGRIYLTATKEKKAKVVELPENLKAYLDTCSHFKAAKLNDRLCYASKAYRAAFKSHCRASGVDYKGVSNSRATFASHALKGLYNSNMAKVSTQLGHSGSATTINHYAQAIDKADSKAYFQIQP